MLTFQPVTGERMLKAYVAPMRLLMAGCTLFFRIVLGIQDGCMDVLVAVAAPYTDLPEFPAVAFPVAFKTWGSLMSLAKDKGGAVVPLDGEQGGGESLLVMAFRTIRHRGHGYELFPVVIGVAVAATGMFQRAPVPVLVAGCAGDGLVPSLQGESGGRMVEVPRILDLVEGGLRMAFGAVLSEAVLVHVPVAVCTVCMGKGFEIPGFLSIPGNGPVAQYTI